MTSERSSYPEDVNVDWEENEDQRERGDEE